MGTTRVRIIGGRWRRSVLSVPEVPGLRPTPDRIRETLFNWLGQDLSGWSVLDAFSGTGALGLEAASRGAAPVVLVEQSPPVVKALHAHVERLQAGDASGSGPRPGDIEIVRADALAWMRRASTQGRRFRLVLLDPPYAAGLLEPCLTLLTPLTEPGGWAYVEAGAPLATGQLPAGWAVFRTVRAGQVHAHLLTAPHGPAHMA